MRRAKIIENDGRVDRVRVGNTVTVVEVGYEHEAEIYHIVGVHEADPSNGRISNESPIGRALLGSRVGETVVAYVPAGEVKLTIKDIE